MGNVNAVADSWNCPNYTGELFLIGANQTPFLNLIGGLQGGAIRTVRLMSARRMSTPVRFSIVP